MHDIATKNRMGGGRIGNAAFLLIFFGLLLVPIIFFDEKSRVCPIERRQLAYKPYLIKDGRLNNDYNRSFDEWLADRIGFRLPLIFFYQNIHLKIYGQFHHPLGIFGINKELYYIWDLRQMVLDDAAIDSIARAMEDGVIAKVRNFNKPYLVVLVPGKYTLDTTTLPWFVRRYGNSARQTAEEAVLSRMTAANADNVLFPLDECRRQNIVQKLYPPLNYHWVPSRYTAIMASLIAERFELSSYKPPAPENFVTSSVISDQLRRELPGVENPAWVRKSNHGAEILSPSFGDAYPSVPFRQYICDYYVNEANANTGKALLVGDSFIRAIGGDLAEYFGELVSVSFANESVERRDKLRSLVDGILRDYQPDYIVFLSIRSMNAVSKIEYLPTIPRGSEP